MIHFANTDFEFELAGLTCKQELLTQLYYLPMLFANEGDAIYTDSSYESNLFRINDFQRGEEVFSWGYSLRVAKWAKERGLIYEMPSFSVVKEVNSKIFSFTNSLKLEQATLLYSMEEVHRWINSFKGEKVLKTAFGVSGKGHFFIQQEDESLKKFLMREFLAKRPVIGEPWMERAYDFSTQWFVHKNGSLDFLGITKLENTTNGTYLGTTCGNIQISYLEEQQNVALQLIEKAKKLGYFGFIGIDAMVLKNGSLHPVVEMNARRTLGLTILQYQQKYHPNTRISVRFEKADSSKQPLLPSQVYKNEQKVIFMKNLYSLSSIS